MEIGASLAHLELFSGDPQALAAFYASTFGLKAARDGDTMNCSAAGRELVIMPGEGGQLCRASFRFLDEERFEAHRNDLRVRGVETIEHAGERVTVRDPEGRLITFLAPAETPQLDSNEPLAARLQHFGVRTPEPAPLVDFYADKLGFIVSDRVLDDEGRLTAAFLRTDSEHHSMAIFRAPTVRFDHFSCEAPGWEQLRDWADHMAAVGVDLAWGIGRHGPGNDTFLMVKDMDGNMGEISSDLEVCEPGRPAGVWPHRQQTLNQWGVAIMRS
jgi:catechol 2,3-dioxygenase